jgi:hypothetical protein
VTTNIPSNGYCYDCSKLTGGRCWRHSAPIVIQPEPRGIEPYFVYERIAAALERIAAALEAQTPEGE